MVSEKGVYVEYEGLMRAAGVCSRGDGGRRGGRRRCRRPMERKLRPAAALRGDRGALKRLSAPLALGAVADALFVEAARKALPGLVTAAASPAEAVEAVRTRWPALVPS